MTVGPMSPPPDLSQISKNKNQKSTKDQASNISLHVKRAVEGISSKIDKGNIDKIIADSQTAEGCYYILNSIINVFDNNANSDSVILKALEVLYILLQTSNTTFRSTAQPFMPEIITITTLNFKKSKVKLRDTCHELAKAIYLNLQSNKPLPSPTQLGLADNLSSLIPISVDRSKNDNNDDVSNNILPNENENAQIDFVNDSATKKGPIKLNNFSNISFDDMDNNDNINKNILNDDLIDCDNADDKINDNTTNHLNSLKQNDNADSSMIKIGESHNYPSKAKQVFDDYLKKNGLSDDVKDQSAEVNKSFDNLLLMPDGSFPTSSNYYSSNNILNNRSNQTINVNIPNDSNNINNLFDNNNQNNEINSTLDQESTSLEGKRQPKHFKISKGKGESISSPNIPRSQSLRSNMPSIQEQNSKLANGQETNLSVLIDPNQIIDLTKPSSTPNSPPGSVMDSNQNSYLDSILNSAPIKNPTHLPAPSTFNPSSGFESPDTTSNYNSDSTSTIILNTNQYLSQISKSNSILNTSSNFNSNLALNSDIAHNSVSDSILKIPSKELISSSRTSDIPLFNPTNLQLNQGSSKFSFSKTSNSSNFNQNNGILINGSINTIGDNNSNSSHIRLNNQDEQKTSNSLHIQVEHFPVQNTENINSVENNGANFQPPKTKKSFRIEKKPKGSKRHKSFSIPPIDTSINNSFSDQQKQNNNNLFNSNDDFDQDYYMSSLKGSTNEDDDDFTFQSKPSVGLEDDLDSQFEPITPIQSSNIQTYDENGNATNQNNSISKLTQEQNSIQSDEKFGNITPVKKRKESSLSDGGFEPINIQTPDLNVFDDSDKLDNNIFNSSNNDNPNNEQELDDQFVPITPVRNGNDLITDDEIFAKTPDKTNSINDKYGAITPTKNDELYKDQFEPITPVKNFIEDFDDDDDVSKIKNDNIRNNQINNNSNNESGSIPNSVDSGMFVPISPVFHELPYSDDQFIPMSPVPNNLGEISDNSIPGLNNINNNALDTNNLNIKSNFNVLGNYDINNMTPKSRRHLSFDSGVQSGSNISDRFEAITPPNARSMFALSSPSYRIVNENQSNKNESEIPRENKVNDNSFSDQFEPITPPSSLQKRSQIQDLLSSSTEQVIPPTEQVFDNQNEKVNLMFDENLDKQLNKNMSKNGNHHIVTFEISKQAANEDSNQGEFDNFEPINPAENNNNSEKSNDDDLLIDAKQTEEPPAVQNVVDLRPIVPNNNSNGSSKRFSIKRTPSPQIFDENINN